VLGTSEELQRSIHKLGIIAMRHDMDISYDNIEVLVFEGNSKKCDHVQHNRRS
jgi:hypothetical protein